MENRRRIFSSFTLAAILIGINALAVLPASAEPVKVRLYLDWFPEAEHGGFYDAMVRHLFADAGIDFDIIPASPGASVTAVLLNGSSNFCLGTSDQILIARSQGINFVSIMALMQHDPKAVMVHDESPVKDFPDLEGRAIACTPGVSWLQFLAKKYQFKHLRETRLTFGVGNFLHDPNYIQECFVTSEPFFASQQGAKVRTLLLHQSGWDPYRVVSTSDTFLNAHRDVVVKFVRISMEGWKHYLVSPELADAEIKKRNPSMTQPQLDFSRRALIENRFIEGFPEKGETMGLLASERMAATYKSQRELGIITHDYDYSKAFDSSFVEIPSKPVNP